MHSGRSPQKPRFPTTVILNRALPVVFTLWAIVSTRKGCSRASPVCACLRCWGDPPWGRRVTSTPESRPSSCGALGPAAPRAPSSGPPPHNGEHSSKFRVMASASTRLYVQTTTVRGGWWSLQHELDAGRLGLRAGAPSLVFRAAVASRVPLLSVTRPRGLPWKGQRHLRNEASWSRCSGGSSSLFQCSSSPGRGGGFVVATAQVPAVPIRGLTASASQAVEGSSISDSGLQHQHRALPEG